LRLNVRFTFSVLDSSLLLQETSSRTRNRTFWRSF